jgi:hypothetical protein
MKKLSEIGAALSRHPVDGGMIPFDPKLEEKHTLHIYTPAERRELVKAVWDECKNAFLAFDDPMRGAVDKYFADWMKEQGL